MFKIIKLEIPPRKDPPFVSGAFVIDLLLEAFDGLSRDLSFNNGVAAPIEKMHCNWCPQPPRPRERPRPPWPPRPLGKRLKSENELTRKKK